MTQAFRFKRLNTNEYKGGDIAYWTEGALRLSHNLAHQFANDEAIRLGVQLDSFCTVDSKYGHTNIRQLVFLIEALSELRSEYRVNKQNLHIYSGDTSEILAEKSTKNNWGMLVVSASYCQFFRTILEEFANSTNIPVIMADDNSLLPPWIASDKEEYAAYTLRKKYWKKCDEISISSTQKHPEKYASSLEYEDSFENILTSDWYQNRLLEVAQLSRGEASIYPGGSSHAQKKFRNFLDTKIDTYHERRNEPNEDTTSGLSPYLHFGCISPVQIYFETQQYIGHIDPTDKESAHPGGQAFLEELFVRRELAINSYHHNEHHASWKILPNWAIVTLDEQKEFAGKGLDHRGDTKQATLGGINEKYTLDELMNARTSDQLWNAAQNQLKRTGKIHGYLRMYWGKQIITWFDDWREAYDVAVQLNDIYAIDGLSPNGYTGVAWCFGKHDRPFPPKKPHWGLVRSMKISGMKKKFNTNSYIHRWQ